MRFFFHAWWSLCFEGILQQQQDEEIWKQLDLHARISLHLQTLRWLSLDAIQTAPTQGNTHNSMSLPKKPYNLVSATIMTFVNMPRLFTNIVIDYWCVHSIIVKKYSPMAHPEYLVRSFSGEEWNILKLKKEFKLIVSHWAWLQCRFHASLRPLRNLVPSEQNPGHPSEFYP